MKGIQPHFQNVTALVSFGDHTFWSMIGKTNLLSHGTPAFGGSRGPQKLLVWRLCWKAVGPLVLESCQSPFTWKADLPFLWVPWYHIVMSSSYHCTIIIIIKSSYNHISMSPSYYRSSQHIISHQYEVMITYFQHKFLQLLCVVYEVPFPFYSECMHELLSFRTAFISCHFFQRVSFTRFKDYRKCCNHFINLTLVQFRECENCWLWIATAPNSFAQVGTPGPRSLATPYSVQIFNSTQSVEGFFSRVTLEER